MLGREVFMTVFRQAAASKGVVIAAIRSAKWKTAFQLVWQGSAYCWFWAVTLAAEKGVSDRPLWRDFAKLFNGTVGTLDDGRRRFPHPVLAHSLHAELQ